jgi:hypothetical protein
MALKCTCGATKCKVCTCPTEEVCGYAFKHCEGLERMFVRALCVCLCMQAVVHRMAS